MDAVSVSSAYDAQRAQQMEKDLANIRQAFEDYVVNTQYLESGMDQEIHDMQGKLEASTRANATLASQLKKMDPMLKKLELSLEGTKKRLKEESRRRRQAEARCKELEALRVGNATPRKIYDIPNLQMSGPAISTTRSGEVQLRNVATDVTEAASNRSKSYKRDGPVSNEAYSEVVEELNTVTEELVTTQQKLWKTEDQLRDLRRSASGSGSVELEVVRAELAAAQQDFATDDAEKPILKSQIMDKVKQQEMELDEYIERNRLLEEQVHQTEEAVRESEQEVARYEALLDESREENTRLMEEIRCLRDVLPFSDHFDSSLATVGNSKIELREKIEGELRAKILKEANKIREQEINALRDQFKKAFKENSLLREKIEKLQSGNPSTNLGIEEHRLKREIERVNDELRAAQEKHKVTLLEMESSWKTKIEQMMTGEFIPEDLLEEMGDEMRTTIDAAAAKVSAMKEEKALTETVDKLQRELLFSESKIRNLSERGREHEAHQKSSREEILRLKKSNTHLTSELEYTTRVLTPMDGECERLTREHAKMKTELEVAVQVIDSSSMDDSHFSSNDTSKLKEQCHALTTKLNKLNEDYFCLQGELEIARQKYLDIHEETVLKSASEVQFLAQRIIELEEMQVRSRIEQSNLSKTALEEHENEVKDLVIAERKSCSLELIETLEMKLFDERESTRSLQMELKQCKDALSSSRIGRKRLEGENLEKIVPSDQVLSHNQSTPIDDPFGSSHHPFAQSKQNDLSCDGMGSLKAKLAVRTKGLEVSEQRLFEARTELLKTEYSRSQFVEENDIMKTEIDTMKQAAEKSLDNTVVKSQGIDNVIATLASEEGALDELKRKHKELSEEKISLQHEVDDSKIALSVSHYSQERCKEELRACQSRLDSAMDDVYALKDELEKMTTAFEELKMDHDDLLEQKDGLAVDRKMKKEVSELSKQLQAIMEVNASLQQKKEELTSKQSRVQFELQCKEDEVKSLQSSLVLKQEETRLLNEEVSNLSAIYENANKTIKTLTNELEASNKRLEKSQIEAEKNGRDIAEAEARELLEAEKESGRGIREQLEKAMADCVSLKATVDSAKSALREAKKNELLVGQSVDVWEKSPEHVEDGDKDGDVLEFEGEFDHFIERDHAILEQVENDEENELPLSTNVEERTETEIRVLDEVEALVSELLGHESSTMAADRPPADPVEALKKEISQMIEDKADLMKQVDEALSSSSSNSSDALEEALGGPIKMNQNPTTQSDLEATNNVLKRIDDMLIPFDSDGVNHELRSRIEKQKRLVSTAQKAEVIRRKVSFLTYSLCKSRKEHSDVLIELTAAKSNINALLEKLQENERDQAGLTELRKENHEVLQRLEATELTLRAAMDSEKKRAIDAEAKFGESQKQCEESRALASYYKAQVDKLEERNQKANIDKASLEEELAVLKRRVNDLIQEAEQRETSESTQKKDYETPSIPAQDSEDLLALTQRFFHENVELQDRLQETEKTLAAARDVKRQLDGKTLLQVGEPSGSSAASVPTDSTSALRHHVASMAPAAFAPKIEASEDGLKQAPRKELSKDGDSIIFGSMEARTDERHQERE